MPVSEQERDLIADLQAHPGWQGLRSVARERMERQFSLFSARLMSGEPPSEGEIQYARGFFAGMKCLLDKPKLEASAIAKELAREEVKASAGHVGR